MGLKLDLSASLSRRDTNQTGLTLMTPPSTCAWQASRLCLPAMF